MGSRINIYSVELIRESAKIYDVDRQVNRPEDAYKIIEKVLSLSTKTKEHFVMLSFDSKLRVIGVHTIHIGSTFASIVHPKDVLQPAILNNATAFMVFHNHPSGNPQPSPEDLEVTTRLAKAGDIIGIELLDHIIIGDNTYVSLKERGYIE